MRAPKYSVVLVLSAALSASMGADAGSSRRESSHSSVNTFSWTEDGQSLVLRSQSDGASAGEVLVMRAEPSPFHGLRAGDVILAVDGRPLHQVEGLMRALRASRPDVALRVRHDGADTTLVWSRADYRALVPPPPPAPPAPPASPAPPAPPAPPTPHA